MGIVSASGATLPETLERLDASVGGMVSTPPFDTAFPYPVFLCPLSTHALAELPATYSRTVALAVRSAREALRDADFEEKSIGSLRMGVAVGTSVGASLDFFDFYRDSAAGNTPPLDDIKRYRVSNPATALAGILGCLGPAQSVTNACSSGTDAIGLATSWVRSGLCDLALAGGADALSLITYVGFSSLRLPSAEPCRPFDAERSGLTLGEGAGFMLLESEALRKKRNAKAKAYIAGYGTATDAHHLTTPHPDAAGLALAVRQAFVQCAGRWEDVAFINAHGTGTRANDAAEAAFFREHCPEVPFIATKGATGHTLGAAGAVEAVLTAAHLNKGLLPPSSRFSSPDPALGVAPVSAVTQVRGRFALSQSLAFGGNNSVLLIAEGESC
jgi:3-oxoacyl-[acyl-carrier-protein] synthase-1/3-oxoacyl-[acyl-carrier-protein] synthase II